MHKVLMCLPIHEEGRALLDARRDIQLTELYRPTRAQIEAAIADHDAIVVGLEPVDQALLDHAPSLTVVSRFGVGYDLIDIPACTRRRVVVGVTNGANDLAVAEHTLMLMLAVSRRTVECDQHVRAGKWTLRDDRRLRELAGQTILVVGYGRIGTRVARLCAAFGMRVMVNDPNYPIPRIAADGHIAAPHLMQALPEADIVTLHCPLDENTRHMINREAFSLMRPGAWLINAARGGIVDEAALIAALESGHLGAAGLDVLVHEPPAMDHPLFKMPNVVLSPHNAAQPVECFAKMSVRAARNIIEHFDGTLEPGFVVNPETLGLRRNA